MGVKDLGVKTRELSGCIAATPGGRVRRRCDGVCDMGRNAVAEEEIKLIGREDPRLIGAGGVGVEKEGGQNILI